MKAESDNLDTSAKVVWQRSIQNWQDQSKTNHPKTTPNIDKSTFKCTHRNKTSHTKSHCFELVGYPDWWDHNRDQQKNDSKKTSTAIVVEIKTKYNVAEKTFVLVAATDYGGKFLNTSTPVINNHMTFDFRQISTLKPSSQKIISTANGNTTLVIGKGSLTLTDTLNLDYVLVVPSLDYNLLSISQITTALSCIDIQTRQTIGCGIKRDKLYYLDLQSKDSNKLDNTIEPFKQFGSEDAVTEIPNQSLSADDILNLEPDPFMKQLTHRHNRGILKPTYELELSTKVKYPMSNYVSNHRLFKSNKSFVNQLSTVVIPNSVQEALVDPW
ncbi:hypothetical protein AAG906_006944 [Vitis piasezkii]